MRGCSAAGGHLWEPGQNADGQVPGAEFRTCPEHRRAFRQWYHEGMAPVTVSIDPVHALLALRDPCAQLTHSDLEVHEPRSQTLFHKNIVRTGSHCFCFCDWALALHDQAVFDWGAQELKHRNDVSSVCQSPSRVVSALVNRSVDTCLVLREANPKARIRILEPHAGDGVLAVALLVALQNNGIFGATATVVELIPQFASATATIAAHTGVSDQLRIVSGDFFDSRLLSGDYDVIICNPQFSTATVVIGRCVALLAPNQASQMHVLLPSGCLGRDHIAALIQNWGLSWVGREPLSQGQGFYRNGEQLATIGTVRCEIVTFHLRDHQGPPVPTHTHRDYLHTVDLQALVTFARLQVNWTGTFISSIGRALSSVLMHQERHKDDQHGHLQGWSRGHWLGSCGPAHWVQCSSPQCVGVEEGTGKWRVLAPGVMICDLEDDWTCDKNWWHPWVAACSYRELHEGYRGAQLVTN